MFVKKSGRVKGVLATETSLYQVVKPGGGESWRTLNVETFDSGASTCVPAQ